MVVVPLLLEDDVVDAGEGRWRTVFERGLKLLRSFTLVAVS